MAKRNSTPLLGIYRNANALVAAALLIVSLRHQAHGVLSTTGVPVAEAWLMAIGIDLAMVASELAILSGIRTGWSRAILITTLCISAGYNVLGFWNPGALWWYNALAVALGVFVPSAIYGLLDTVNRKPPRVISGAAKPQRAKARTRGRVVAIRSG